MDELLCPVARWSEESPSLCALIIGSDRINYAQLNQHINWTATHLRNLGIDRGDRVALQFRNSSDYIALIIALTRIGALGVLLSTRLPHSAVERSVSLTGCRILLKEQDWNLPTSSHPSTETERVSMNLPAVAIFTSGSTGEPKAALLSYGNLYYNALGSNQNLPFGPDDRWLLSLPLYHVGGLGILFRVFIAGGTVVIPDESEDLGETIQTHQITHLSVVTTQLHRLLAQPFAAEQFRSLKGVLLGGSAVPPQLIDRALDSHWPICTSYGLSEMASQVTTTAPSDTRPRLKSSGKLLMYRELKVSPSSEILVRGQTRFLGYLTESGLEEPFDHEGWFATGDLGKIDDDGYLNVFGRSDNLFISGGENIQPEEIERELSEDESVEEVMVVPIATAEFGFRPVAFVKMAALPPHDVPEILETLRTKLPGYKIPDRILPWPEHLVIAGIKPSRAALGELAQTLCGPL